MSGSLNIIDEKELAKLFDNNKRKSQSLFPELIKRLIDCSCQKVKYIRMPSRDEVSQKGYDGIIQNGKGNRFVVKGVSVWELGTNKNVSRKIKDDLTKRTKNPLDIDPERATLYLCTPFVSRDAQNGRLITKNEKYVSKWGNVIIYDASIICDWINQSPTVCAWLIENFLDKRNIGFKTLERAWNELADTTTPKLSHSFFRTDISIPKQLLKDNKVVVISAKDKIDSYGYILTYLIENKIKNVIVVENEESLKALEELSNNHIIVADFKPKKVTTNNTLILCLNKQCGYLNKTLLPDRRQEDTQNALIEMGINNHKAYKICASTHCSTYPILRKIANKNNKRVVGWSREGTKNIIEKLLFIQHYVNDSEKKILSILTGKHTTDLEDALNDISEMEDSPIKRVNGGYIISSPEEVIDICDIDTSKDSYKRANELLYKIVKSLIDTGGWEGKTTRQIYQEKVLSRLAKGYIYASYKDRDHSTTQNDISILLRNTKIIGNHLVVNELLPILSEAAPNVIIDYLKEITDSVLKIAKDDFETYIAIEESLKIIAEEGYLEDVCKILLLLSKTIDNKNVYNTPKNALKDILSIWNLENRNTKEEKIRNISVIFDIDSKIATDIVIDLINKQGYSTTMRINDNAIDRKITYGEIWDYYRNITSLALANNNGYRQSDLIEAIIDNRVLLGPEDNEKIIMKIDAKILKKSEIASLTTRIEYRKKWASERNNKNELAILEKIEQVLLRQSIIRKPWLFSEFFNVPISNNDGKQFDEKYKLIQKIRKEEFSLIKKKNGYIKRIVEIINDDYYWGAFIIENDNNHAMSYIDELIETNKPRTIAGIIDGIRANQRKEIIQRLKGDIRITIIQLCQSDIYQFLTQDEEEEYWKSKTLRSYTEIGYKKLLKYNPEGLIPYIFTEKEASIETVSEIITAINIVNVDKENTLFNGEYELIEIAKRYENAQSDYLDEEFSKLLLNGRINKATEQCNRYFIKDINRIKDLCAKRDKFLFHNLLGLKLPRCAYVSYDSIKNVLDGLKDEDNGLSVITILLKNSLFNAPTEEQERKLLEYIEKSENSKVLIKSLSKMDSTTIYDTGRGRNIHDESLDKYYKYKESYPNASNIYKLLRENTKRESEYLSSFSNKHSIDSDQSIL